MLYAISYFCTFNGLFRIKIFFYVYKENVQEEWLFCCPLKDHTRGKNIYRKVDEFLKTESLEWKNCYGVCTDVAKAMTGKNIGFKSLLQAANYEYITFAYSLTH